MQRYLNREKCADCPLAIGFNMYRCGVGITSVSPPTGENFSDLEFALCVYSHRYKTKRTSSLFTRPRFAGLGSLFSLYTYV